MKNPRQGNGVRTLAIELLEDRSLLASGAFTSALLNATLEQAPPDPTSIEAPDVMRVRMATTDLDGKPIGQVEPGEYFQLEVWVTDWRENPHGIFAHYQDIQFDADRVVATELEHGGDYGQGGVPNPYQSETVEVAITEPGLLDEVGSFSSSIARLGASERLLLSVTFQATSPGLVEFSGNPADSHIIRATHAYDWNHSIPTDQIQYGTATIAVSSGGDTSPTWVPFAADASSITASDDSPLAESSENSNDASAAAPLNEGQPVTDQPADRHVDLTSREGLDDENFDDENFDDERDLLFAIADGFWNTAEA